MLLLSAPEFEPGVVVVAVWLFPASAPAGGVLGVADAVPWLLAALLSVAGGVVALEFCCADVWSFGFIVALWLLAAPACGVAPWGAVAAELDGLAGLAFA